MRLPCSISRWLLALLLLLPMLLGAKADVDGYKGMRWGSYLTDLQQTKKLVLTKEGGKSGASLYALENDDLRFGKATLTAIQYSFTKERLGGVILLFSGAKNFTAMKTEALAKYGESQKIEVGGDEMYNWTGANSTTVLSYNPKTQAGFLFLKPKKMPPPVKAAVKKPTAPADAQTALDRAPPPPKVLETRPTTRPEDMETALDRAPPLPSQPTAERFSPEIEAMINRDQALTQLCWETVGPAADAACKEMRANIERLEGLGLCAVPDATGPSGTETVWQRCGSPTAPSPQPVPQAPPQAMSGAAPLQAYPETVPSAPPHAASQPQANPARDRLCQQIGELFAAAAAIRDNGSEPRVAEEELAWYQTDQYPEITIERIRETVELVYFDQSYSEARGDQLADQVRRSCLNRRGPFAQPLP